MLGYGIYTYSKQMEDLTKSVKSTSMAADPIVEDGNVAFDVFIRRIPSTTSISSMQSKTDDCRIMEIGNYNDRLLTF